MKELRVRALEDVILTIGPVSIGFKKDEVQEITKQGLAFDEFYSNQDALDLIYSGKLKVELSDEDLRIYKILNPQINPLHADFTILGFRKISPSYDRGRKTRAIYKCVADDHIVIEKVFQDVRDEQGILTALDVTFNWYKQDGTVGLTKTETVKEFNKFEAQTEERKRRERQLDYLIGSAKGTPLEPYVDIVFSIFGVQEQKYRTHGSNELAIALDASMKNNAPENAQLFAILNTPVPRNDDPTKTILLGDSILYQIGFKTLAEVI